MDGSSADRARAALGNREHRDGLRAGGALSPLYLTAEQARGVPLGSGGTSSGTLTSGPVTALASEGLGKGACESDGSGAGDRGSAALPYSGGNWGSERLRVIHPKTRGQLGAELQRSYPSEATFPSFTENFE